MKNGLFIAFYNSSSVGAQKKMLSQLRNISKNMENTYSIFMVTNDEEANSLKSLNIPNLHVVQVGFDVKLPKLLYRRYFNRYQEAYIRFVFWKRLSKKVLEKIESFDLKFDLAYVRYSYGYFFLRKLGRMTKLLVEHNTNDLVELKHRKDDHNEITEYYLEKYYSKYNLKNVAVGIAVSQEIKEAINKRRPNYIKFIWNNPLDLSMYEPRSLNIRKGELNLAVMIGSLAAWHGLDILTNAIRNYQGDRKVILHFIGSENADIKELFSGLRVVYHGRCNIQEQREIYSYCDGGIDSLAHFRIGMKISPSLKSKEYFAFGLPFVSGSVISMEAANDSVKDYYLHLDVENKEMSLETLILFLDKINNNSNHPAEMHGIMRESFNMELEYKKLFKLCAA